MATRLSKAAEKKIRDILVANWTPSQTYSYDPTIDDDTNSNQLPIHFGTYDQSLGDPQITITHPNGEDTEGGSFSGMSNSGPNKEQVGNPLIQCWAEEGKSYNNGASAEEVVRALREEVQDVILHNWNADGDFWSLSVTWDGRFPDDQTPPRWQSQLTAQYRWLQTQ